MANNLSFSVRLELLVDKFLQGAESAKSALRSIQFQVLAMVGALGAGVTSIQGLISSLVDTARHAAKARIVLRNISTDTREYVQSLRFLSDLTRKYGTDLIGTTEAFAKFKAAAGASGIAVSEQERIFANVSKAMASFGISGGEATLTMMAITQMMSKGKVSSEELRRQLGERMPIAMQAMANAAGVSMGELDKLLKDGKLRSAEIMGRFSDELAKLSGDTSTDNLESSLGRLKNAFTELTDALRIGEHFKSAVEKVQNALDYLRTHLSNFYIWAGALLVGKLWGKFSNAWTQADAVIRSSQAQAIADDASAKKAAEKSKLEAEKALRSAQEKVARAEAALEKASSTTPSEQRRISVAQQKGDARFNSAVISFDKAQAEYRRLTAIHRSYLKGIESSELEVAQRLALAKSSLASAQMGSDDKTIREAQRTYDKVLAEASRLHAKNATLREQAEINYAFKADELQKKIALTGEALNKAQYDRKELLAKAHAQNEEQRAKKLSSLQLSLDRERAALGAQAKNIPTAGGSLSGVGNAQRAIAYAGQLSFRPVVADAEQASTATVSLWTRTTTTFRVLWASAVATVRSLLSSLVPMAILGAITAIVTAMVDWYRKQKEINGLQAKYRADLANVSTGHSEESQKLLQLYNTYKSLNGQVEEQKTVQHQIERALGLQEGALDRLAGKYDAIITKAVRIKALERQTDFLAQTETDIRSHFTKVRIDYQKANPSAVVSQANVDAVTKALGGYSKELRDQAAMQLRRETRGYNENDIRIRAVQLASQSANGRPLSAVEVGILRQQVKSGLTYIDFDESVANAKVLSQTLKDRTVAEKKLAETTVEYEKTLSANGIQKAGAVSASASSEDGKNGKKSDLQRAREAAEKDRLEVERKQAAQLYKTTDEYRLALDKVAQNHTERLASLLGARALEDQQYRGLQALLLSDRELIEEKQKSVTELRTLSAKVAIGIASEDELIQARADRAKAEISALLASGKELDTSDAYVAARLEEIAEVSAIAQLHREYIQASTLLLQQRNVGILTETEYNKELAQLIEATRKKALVTSTASASEVRMSEGLQSLLRSDLTEITPALLPKHERRDTTFDYKKSELDKKKDEKKLLDEYIKELEKAEKAGIDVSEALKKVQAEAKTLEQAMKLAELEDDLKKFQKSATDKTKEGMKSVAQSARNLKSAFDGLQKAFDPESNASAWERFFAVFDSAFQGIDTIMGLVSMIEELTKARQTAAAVEKAITAEKLAQTAAVTAAEATGTATEVGLAATRTAATTVETKADIVGASAKVAKAHAALPFVGVAIAGAMIGALIATIASSASKVPKFANGGIVPGGDGSGDRVLARVNPGELILNKAQQGRLANHLTSSNGVKVEVEGRIRARDILHLVSVAQRHKTR